MYTVEVKIKEIKKSGSCQESNPRYLACAASGLPLSYDNQTFFCNRCIYVLRMFTEICGTKIFHRLGMHTKFDSCSRISVTATRR